jgi:hypothetical protein
MGVAGLNGPDDSRPPVVPEFIPTPSNQSSADDGPGAPARDTGVWRKRLALSTFVVASAVGGPEVQAAVVGLCTGSSIVGWWCARSGINEASEGSGDDAEKEPASDRRALAQRRVRTSQRRTSLLGIGALLVVGVAVATPSGPIDVVAAASAFAYVLWYFSDWQPLAEMKREAGLRRILAPTNRLRRFIDVCKQYGWTSVDQVVSGDGDTRPPPISVPLILVVALAGVSTATGDRQWPHTATRAIAEGVPVVGDLVGEPESDREGSPRSPAGPAVIGAKTTPDPSAASTDLGVISSTLPPGCDVDVVYGLLHRFVPELPADELYQAWADVGAPAAGCISRPPEVRGSHFVVETDSSPSAAVVVPVDGRSSGALVRAEAWAFLQDEMADVAMVEKRRRMGVAGIQLVRWVGDSCGVLYEPDGGPTMDIPPSVVALALGMADTGGLPDFRISSRMGRSTTYEVRLLMAAGGPGGHAVAAVAMVVHDADHRSARLDGGPPVLDDAPCPAVAAELAVRSATLEASVEAAN